MPTLNSSPSKVVQIVEPIDMPQLELAPQKTSIEDIATAIILANMGKKV
jgi:hypothetical protein